MANILILNPIIPFPANRTGNTVRVLPLSAQLAKNHQLFLGVFESDPERQRALEQLGLYKQIFVLPQSKTKRFARLFFPRTGNLDSISRPSSYKASVNMLRQIMATNRIDVVLIHTLMLAEYGEVLPCKARFIDDTDCHTLALEREYFHMSRSMTSFQKTAHYLLTKRAIYQETHLTEKFDYVLTISPVDKKVLDNMNNHGKERIMVVPNGISPEFTTIKEAPSEEINRAIALWGALDFPPNREAVNFFYEEVYSMYLRDSRLKWFIIGKNPPPGFREMAKKHPNIILAGFVDNLPAFLQTIPVMINPMKMGSGLKNKVLEAFALKKLVISTKLGMEALPAKQGVHYVNAETGPDFADAILHYLSSENERTAITNNAYSLVMESYTWEKIGAQLNQLIEMALEK